MLSRSVVFYILTVAWLIVGLTVYGGADFEGMTDIHDIRPPLQVGLNPAFFYWAGGAVPALAGLTALLLWIRRLKKSGPGVTGDITAAIYETPAEEARRRLEALARAPLPPAADFYFQLSAVFRGYLKRRFGLEALEMTTEELLPRLNTIDLERDLRERAGDFLRFGDGVKFARAACDRDQMTAHLDFVRDVVARTSGEDRPEQDREEGHDVSLR